MNARTLIYIKAIKSQISICIAVLIYILLKVLKILVDLIIHLYNSK